MRWTKGPLLAAAAIAAPLAAAQAVPIEGSDVASLNTTGFFTFAGGSLSQSSVLNFVGGGSAMGSQGYGTVDGSTLSTSSFALNGLGGLGGPFQTIDFNPFPAGDPVFGGVDTGGTFSFTPTEVVLTEFDPDCGPDEEVDPVDQITCVEIVALGDVSVIYDGPASEQFDEPSEFSLVFNGSSVNGSGQGAFQTSLTTPPSFDSLEELPEPAALGFLVVGAAAAFAATRRRDDAPAK